MLIGDLAVLWEERCDFHSPFCIHSRILHHTCCKHVLDLALLSVTNPSNIPTHSHTRLSAQPSAASTIWTGGSSACTSPAITKIATTRCGLILPHLHRFCRTFTCLRVAHSYFFVNELATLQSSEKITMLFDAVKQVREPFTRRFS